MNQLNHSDHMNERLKKEKEIVSKKEKWVNEKIKIEMEYEKAQVNTFLSSFNIICHLQLCLQANFNLVSILTANLNIPL